MAFRPICKKKQQRFVLASAKTFYYLEGYYSLQVKIFENSKKQDTILSILSISLLAFIALSAAQSTAQTRIHNAILVIDTSNNASYNQGHWLFEIPYLSIKTSNDSNRFSFPL